MSYKNVHDEAKTSAIKSLYKTAFIKSNKATDKTTQKSNYINRLYEEALKHPMKNVTDLLKDLSITQTQYKNMCESNLSVPDYRKAKWGVSRIKKPQQKTSKSSPPTKRKSNRLNKSGNGEMSDVNERLIQRTKNMSGNGEESRLQYLLEN
jgi:hypothetical protein